MVVLNLIFEQIITEMLSLYTTQSDIFDETPFTFKYVTQQRGWNQRDEEQNLLERFLLPSSGVISKSGECR